MHPTATATPTREELLQAIHDRLDAIDGLDRTALRDVSLSRPRKQSAHSSRVGHEIVLHFANDEKGRKSVWIKRVKRPQAAFERMRSAYERARAAGLAAPIPEPYFFDERWKLVFMEKVQGTPSRKMVLRQSVAFGGSRAGSLTDRLHAIGAWLSRYHRTLETGGSTTFEELTAGIAEKLAASAFSHREQAAIQRHLERCRAAAADDLAVTWTHCDFTLRNILFTEPDGFRVFDWDAMVHPAFSSEAPGWQDVTLFVLNLQSLLRFRPLVASARIESLGEAFLAGYCQAGERALPRNRVEALMYVFALRYWFGIGADRGLPAIYRRNLGWRYVRALRKRLVAGTASLFSAA